MTKQELLKYIRIVLTLCVITALVGALLAGVNALTKDRIAENNIKAMNEAIAVIFGECETSELQYPHANETVKSIYTVSSSGEHLGYCVLVTPKGYGGTMELMVGLNPDGSLKQVSVVSHGETTGIGTKVLSEGYMGQYIGAESDADVDGVDAVSGATRSTNGLKSGIKAALSLGLGNTMVTDLDGEVAE